MALLCVIFHVEEKTETGTLLEDEFQVFFPLHILGGGSDGSSL